jgi:endonuclease III
MPESRAAKQARARKILDLLAGAYPDAKCALNFADPFQLLVATILSAQCTDERVNMVTPALFKKYPTARELSRARTPSLEKEIRSTGFFRAKSRSLLGMARGLVEQHGGQVPDDREALMALPGIGLKTANVVLGNAFGVPGLTVDTHLGRLVRRFGWTAEEDPVKVESEVAELVPKKEWTDFSHRVIFHGRRVCHAKKAACGACGLARWCPSYGIGPTDPEAALKLVKTPAASDTE